MRSTLWTIVVILVILWLFGGFITPVGTSLVHVLLLIILLIVIYDILSSRRRL